MLKGEYLAIVNFAEVADEVTELYLIFQKPITHTSNESIRCHQLRLQSHYSYSSETR